MRQHPSRFKSVELALVATLACASLGACENNKSNPDPTIEPPGQSQPNPIEPEPTPIVPPDVEPDPVEPMAAHSMGEHCPIGASVAAEDTADGIALAFVEGTGDVEDLRLRVQHMASMYETHAGQGTMMWHHMGHMRDEGYQPGIGSEMPAVTARIEDTTDGVRLVLTPKDSAQLADLRVQVREHQKHMTAGECWMPE